MECAHRTQLFRRSGPRFPKSRTRCCTSEASKSAHRNFCRETSRSGPGSTDRQRPEHKQILNEHNTEHYSVSHSSLRTFLAESIRSWPRTASLFPSSSALAAALVRSVNFASAQTIVELGVGTGAITSAILRRMEQSARLYTIDINPVFIAHVKQRFSDRRLVPILGDAKHMEALFRPLNITRVDAVISSLSLTWMEDHTRFAVLSQITRCLSDHAVFTQYQYLHVCAIPPWCNRLGISSFDGRTFLRRYFRAVSTETVLWNLPPAVVYTCGLKSELTLAP